MNPGTLINIEDASTTLTQVGAFSTPMFTALLPIALVGVGLIVGGLVVNMLYHAIIHAVWSAATGGNQRAQGFVNRHPDMF